MGRAKGVNRKKYGKGKVRKIRVPKERKSGPVMGKKNFPKRKKLVIIDTGSRSFEKALAEFYDEHFKDYKNANFYSWMYSIARNDIIVETMLENDTIINRCKEYKIEVKTI